MVPDLNPSLPQPNPTIAALSQLVIGVAGAILVSHSESGAFLFRAAKFSTQAIARIMAVEPGPPCTGLDVSVAAKIPTRILHGDYVSVSWAWKDTSRESVAGVCQGGGSPAQ